MTLLVRLNRSVKVSRLLVCQAASWTVQQMWQLASLIGGKTRNKVLAVKVATVAIFAGKLRKLGRARSKSSAPSSSHLVATMVATGRNMPGVICVLVLVTLEVTVLRGNKVAA